MYALTNEGQPAERIVRHPVRRRDRALREEVRRSTGIAMRLTRDRQAVISAFYPVGILLTAMPLINAVIGTWPIRAASLSWRFGLWGMLLDGMVSLLLGVATLMLVAVLLEHRGALRFVAGATLCGSAVLSVGTVMFVLDYIELRATFAAMPPAGMDAAALKAGLTALIAVPSLILLGRRGCNAAQLSPAELAFMTTDPPLALHAGRTRPR